MSQPLCFQTGMMPVASPTKYCKSCCSVAETGTVQKDLQSKNMEAQRLAAIQREI